VAPTTTSTPAPPRPRRSFQEIFLQRSNQASFSLYSESWGIFGDFSCTLFNTYFICRPSDLIVPDDAGIEPRTVATLALMAASKCKTFLRHSDFFEKFKTFCLGGLHM
jgi:hypothetical protein